MGMSILGLLIAHGQNLAQDLEKAAMVLIYTEILISNGWVG
jgi:hypothetical protein